MSIWVLQVCDLSTMNVCTISLPSYALSFSLSFHGVMKVLSVSSWYLMHAGYMGISIMAAIYSGLYMFHFWLRSI